MRLNVTTLTCSDEELALIEKARNIDKRSKAAFFRAAGLKEAEKIIAEAAK